MKNTLILSFDIFILKLIFPENYLITNVLICLAHLLARKDHRIKELFANVICHFHAEVGLIVNDCFLWIFLDRFPPIYLIENPRFLLIIR